MAAKDLNELVADLLRKNIFKSRRAIAHDIGLKDSAFSLVLSRPDRRLTTDQCFRLANRLRAYPGTILRIANRPDSAAIVDAAWPKPTQTRLTRGEYELIKQWRRISMGSKHHLAAVIQIFAEKEGARSAGPDGPLNTASPKRPRTGPRRSPRTRS